MISCFSVFNLLNLLFKDSPDFNERCKLEVQKIATHYCKGNASNMEQYENKLGAEWKKYIYDMLSWEPNIP